MSWILLDAEIRKERPILASGKRRRQTRSIKGESQGAVIDIREENNKALKKVEKVQREERRGMVTGQVPEEMERVVRKEDRWWRQSEW